MGEFAGQLHLQTWPLLRGLPQYVYVPGRGCNEALHGLTLRCTAVRTQIDMYKFHIHQSACGQVPGDLGGGLLLSLGLSKAFDSVDRAQLFTGLVDCGVSNDLMNFLKAVCTSTSFHFEHRGCWKTFKATRGIRQGCKAPPGPLDGTGGHVAQSLGHFRRKDVPVCHFVC